MGGDISVSSVPDQGSIFTVHLPLVAGAPAGLALAGADRHGSEPKA
jgi:hypothetical protein